MKIEVAVYRWSLSDIDGAVKDMLRRIMFNPVHIEAARKQIVEYMQRWQEKTKVRLIEPCAPLSSYACCKEMRQDLIDGNIVAARNLNLYMSKYHNAEVDIDIGPFMQAKIEEEDPQWVGEDLLLGIAFAHNLTGRIVNCPYCGEKVEVETIEANKEDKPDNPDGSISVNHIS